MINFLNKITEFNERHPWVLNLTKLAFSIAVIVIGSNVIALKNEVLDSLKTIKENTTKLSSCLTSNLDGGIDVVIGVNPKEITENIAHVYDDNKLKLKAGDVIYLSNFADNTFQARLLFVVQKTVPHNGKPTNAVIFIGAEGAKRLGFKDYEKAGTITLKMQRKSPPAEEKPIPAQTPPSPASTQQQP